MAAKKADPYGASVHAYEPDEYRGMRMFTADGDKIGVVVKPDGDIVSAFKHPDSKVKKAANAMLALATRNGGNKLDAFDTVLPRIYSESGFRAVARLPWNDTYAPEGWDKAHYAKFNKGEPDVVFMVHDPVGAKAYAPGDGRRVGSYEEGVAEQARALEELRHRTKAGHDRWADSDGGLSEGYTHISLREAIHVLDAETYQRFADVAYRFFAANGYPAQFDDVMITVRARGRQREDTEIELWPEEDENEDDFMDRCIGELTICIGDRAETVCADKWEASKELGKKGFVSREMLSGDLAIAPCGTSCLGCHGLREKFDPDEPRDEYGRWTTGGSGSGATEPSAAPSPGPKIEPDKVIAKTKTNVARAAKAALDRGVEPLEGSAATHPNTIASRLPTAKGTKKEPALSVAYRQPNLEAMKSDQEGYAHNVALFGNPAFYPNFRKGELGGSVDQQAGAIVSQMKENLKFLYGMADKDTTVWYDGARALVDDRAKIWGFNDASIAGVYAALSPTKDWDQNVHLGDMLMRVYKTQQDHGWDDEMESKTSIWSAKNQKIVDLVRGKKLSELSSPAEKAVWIRTYEEAHGNTDYRVVQPNGALGPIAQSKPDRKGKTAPKKVVWQSLASVTNAVKALEANGDRDKISVAMGSAHKVRSFFNNILDPHSGNDDVTIDTHAVGAALLQAISNKSVPVMQNFGLAPERADKPEGWESAANSTKTGLSGTYALYEQAYQEAAKELGIQARQLQSAVWVVKRSMMTKTNKSEINGVWQEYQSNPKLSLAEVRSKIAAVMHPGEAEDDEDEDERRHFENDEEGRRRDHARELHRPELGRGTAGGRVDGRAGGRAAGAATGLDAVRDEGRGDGAQEIKWDESQHPRVPAGSPEGGQFGEGGGGGGVSSSTSESNYGLVPKDVARFKELKGEWAKVNNELLEYVDEPDGPESKARLDQLESIVKEMHGLHADPGGPEGIGLPGGPRDVVIIGAGPGGLAASINGAAEGLDTLVVEAQAVAGGQAKYSSRIENFPGFPVGVTGERLTQNMYEQAQRLGAEAKLGVRVTGMSYDAKTGLKHITLSNGEKIESRTVILAGGLEFRKMTFPGSEGPGVITGDGKALAKAGKGGNVCVVGGSNGAAQAALGCARGCDRVYLLARSPIVDSMSDYQISALRNNPKVTVIEGDSIARLVRDESGNPQTMETTKGQSIPVKAIGAFIGSMPDTKWVPSEVPLGKGGRVPTNPDLETTLPGVYAVGDMRDGAIGRVGVAVGEGQFALRQANVFLDKQRKEAEAAPAAKADDARARTRTLITQLFDLDRDNPWFGQTMDGVTPLSVKKKKEKSWDEGKHPREPAGGPGGGQFTSGGGGPEPLAAEDRSLLISERPGQEKLDAWNKQINDRQEELNQAGKTGEHEDDQLNAMSMALSAYGQEDEKHLDAEQSGINVRYDLENKLLAAAYTDLIKRPAGDVAKIAYFGALDDEAQRRVINDLVARWSGKVTSLEVQRWKDDPSLPLWEQAGFKQREGQGGLTNLSAVILEKRIGSAAPAPGFENVPVPVQLSEGVGTDFQTEIAGAISQLPKPVLKTMAEGGISFRIGNRMTELNPELKGVHPRGWPPGTTWDSAEGMFSHDQKAVNVTEFYRPVGKKEFVRNDRTRGAFLHESGHAFDYALDRVSSTSAAFIYAYTADRKAIPKEARSSLRYYLQKGRAGRSEAFAEIFGWHIERGAGRQDIRKYFPKTSELVKQAMLRGLWLEPAA